MLQVPPGQENIGFSVRLPTKLTSPMQRVLNSHRTPPISYSRLFKISSAVHWPLRSTHQMPRAAPVKATWTFPVSRIQARSPCHRPVRAHPSDAASCSHQRSGVSLPDRVSQTMLLLVHRLVGPIFPALRVPPIGGRMGLWSDNPNTLLLHSLINRAC